MRVARIAQEEHPYFLEWLFMASRDGGSFISNLSRAGLAADSENYPFIRIVLVAMQEKYPQYAPTDNVKRELQMAVAKYEQGGA